jgi:hypothetical protein
MGSCEHGNKLSGSIKSACLLDYLLDDRGSRVRFLAGVGNFSLHYRVQNGSGAYPVGTLRVKRPGREADHSPPISAEVKECVELYLHSQYAVMAWCSVKAQGQLYLYLHLVTISFSSLVLLLGIG